MSRVMRFAAMATVAFACVSGAQAVDMETVSVGNLGNADDTEGDGYGGVDYVYNIGRFEVTAGQYTEFLNAVAETDTYGLYNVSMGDPSGSWGCNIWRGGSPGSHTYGVDPEWAGRPVNYVSWGDAARFANWLHNGQPAGAQDLNTTEDGSYYLNGATSSTLLMAVVREPDATWVIPSEDEWYKAAYYDGGSDVYYDYPTGTDDVPSNVLSNPDPDPGNNANFYDGGHTIGSPYYRTLGGDFENSESPYDTFDQGGDVWEWNEAVVYSWARGLRGGSFTVNVNSLHAVYRNGYDQPVFEYNDFGFRVAEIPDCNGNGIPDECDISCGDPAGPCDVGGCGESDDINADGIPDECGACCGPLECFQIPEAACESLGEYQGDGTTCEAADCNFIPTVSEWGLVTMALLVLTAATLVLTRRRTIGV